MLWLCSIAVQLNHVYTIQPVVNPVVQLVWQPAVSCKQTSNRLSNGFDNPVERTAVHSTGCQTVFDNRFDKHGLTTVLNEQLFVQPVVKQGCTTGLTTVLNEQLFVQPVVKPCLTNRFDKHGLTTMWNEQLFVQLVVKPGCTMVVQPVWQPVVSCIQTFTQLSNPFDNRLYRVSGALCWQK